VTIHAVVINFKKKKMEVRLYDPKNVLRVVVITWMDNLDEGYLPGNWMDIVKAEIEFQDSEAKKKAEGTFLP
jgi:hypothetical protein